MKRVPALLLALLTCFAHADPLRVCADPDNLPYSRADGSGFENRIAQLIADDFGVPLEYAWLPDRRGFVRKTMGAGLCDVIIGVPAQFERTLNTRPYYRSSYMLLEPAGDASPPASFAAGELRRRAPAPLAPRRATGQRRPRHHAARPRAGAGRRDP